MSAKEVTKARRDKRRAEGLCIFCGAIADRKYQCSKCAERTNERNRLTKKQKASNVCISLSCKNLKIENSAYCEKHKEKISATQKRRYDRLKSENLCIDCSQPNDSGFSFRCKACLEKTAAEAKRNHRVRAKQRLAEGKCTSCGINPHREERKLCISCAQKGAEFRRQRKINVCNAYGGAVCVGCGETELFVLQLDHIAGNGNKHRKEIGGWAYMYKWIIDNGFPPGFRVLCANCNIRAFRQIPFPNDRNL